MYLITDENGNYITLYNYRYTTTSYMGKAQLFDNLIKANNVCSSLPKTLPGRENFKVREYKAGKPDYEPVTKVVPLKPKKKISVEIRDHMSEVSELKDSFQVLKEKVVDIICLKDDYLQKLSNVDMELTDIDHFLENNRISACDGYKLSKFRQDKLRERREIKDKLLEIEILEDANVDKISDRLEGMFDRKYKPRKLPELFEKGSLRFLS